MRTPKVTQNVSLSNGQNEVMPLKDCLAKTLITENQKREGGRNVFDQCSIVGEVAKQLLSRMPPFLRSSLFPVGSGLVAAIHDIGNANFCFSSRLLIFQRNSSLSGLLIEPHYIKGIASTRVFFVGTEHRVDQIPPSAQSQGNSLLTFLLFGWIS